MAADPRYRPPTKVVTVSIPLKTLVVRADPDFQREARFTTFYEMSNGRRFVENEAVQGPYAAD